jgi:hypothetical protein
MKRCVIDTNVLLTANKAFSCDLHDDVQQYPNLVNNCITTLNTIKEKRIYVVLDYDYEIFDEYREHLSFSGQPGVGDAFFKWLYNHMYSFPETERIALNKAEDGYLEYPNEMKAINVDPSDMKFFAVSNAHPSKPAILEATDTKWWNWADAAKQCGIHIEFMDEQYMRDHNK